MYNIKLEIKPNTLSNLCNAIDFDIPPQKNKSMKSYISLLAHVVLKLSKKELANRGAEKPLKIKLEYFEAYCLEQTLKVVLEKSPDRELQNVFDQLNQKLA